MDKLGDLLLKNDVNLFLNFLEFAKRQIKIKIRNRESIFI